MHSYKHGSANGFFPSYGLAHLKTISINIHTLMSLFFLVGHQNLAEPTFHLKFVLNAVISVTSYSAVSVVE
jgi:hypothetical protein